MRSPFAVVSFVPIETRITLEVVQSELVTTREVAAAAKFTDPDALLIVCAPVVPPAVMVFGTAIAPVRVTVVAASVMLSTVLLIRVTEK
jgi:hypothetical protein